MIHGTVAVFAIAIAIAMAGAGTTSAQDGTGHLSGRVLADGIGPAGSVRVAIKGPTLQQARETESDARGYFRLQNLPIGTYQVRLVLVGFRPVRFDSVAVRFAYTPPPWRSGVRPKLYLDVFHLGNSRTALDYEDLHYLEEDADGTPTTPNPLYGRPLLFQAPMSARIGMSLDFGVLD